MFIVWLRAMLPHPTSVTPIGLSCVSVVIYASDSHPRGIECFRLMLHADTALIAKLLERVNASRKRNTSLSIAACYMSAWRENIFEVNVEHMLAKSLDRLGRVVAVRAVPTGVNCRAKRAVIFLLLQSRQ
jgi:hypothetical protein